MERKTSMQNSKQQESYSYPAYTYQSRNESKSQHSASPNNSSKTLPVPTNRANIPSSTPAYSHQSRNESKSQYSASPNTSSQISPAPSNRGNIPSSTPAYSHQSRNESKSQYSAPTNTSSQISPSPIPTPMNVRIKLKSSQFRPLYEELGNDHYEQEAVLMKLKPGRDGREIVRDTTIYPFSAQGRLVMHFDGILHYGSGTLISSRHVLTAAHNIYCHSLRKEADSILFIPALNGSDCPYGTIRVRRYFYPDKFRESKLEDYAMLELEDDIGESTGFFEMRIHRNEEIDNKECSIYGYPGYINRIENHQMYGMSGRVTLSPNRNFLRYYIDTSPGQSGSSIYYYSARENKYLTVGVHTHGYESNYNEGALLTPERISEMQAWIRSTVTPTKHNLENLTAEIYGRDAYLNTLRERMSFRKELSIVALYGSAGVGKSSIALRFATESIGKYDYIWWIDAETNETIKSSLLALANLFKIEGADCQEKLKKLRDHLSSTHSRFLFILDNLEDESTVRSFMINKGHFIITTRLGQIGYDRIEVSTLSNEASFQLLSSRLPDKSPEDLRSLASFLQDLPLALLQSAAYIRKYRIEVRDYIREFYNILNKDEKLRLIVTKNIQSLRRESQHILKIVCLGYYENIPYDMLYTVFCYKYPNTSQNDFNHYLGDIVRLNILSYNIKKELLKIHRVIHQASTLLLSHSINNEVIGHYSNYLYNSYNPQSDIYIREEVDLIKSLTLHTVSFLTNYIAKIIPSRAMLLYTRIAYAYKTFFLDYNSSKKYTQISERLFTSSMAEDADLGNIYNNLGGLYYSMGDYNKSEEFYSKCLKIWERLLPRNHRDLATIYEYLGALYDSKGDYARSEEYYLKCLRIREAILPSNSADLASIYNNLGALYVYKGNCTLAEEYYSKCLRIREAILPHTHPDLANIYNNLGVLYRSIADYTRSEEYYTKCLRIWEVILPGNHPDLAQLYNNIGVLYRSMGELKRSEEFKLKCLRIREAILPSNHPDLATVYNNLGVLYRTMEEYTKSEEYYWKCLRIRESTLPPNHPNLAIIYNSLGVLYDYMKNYSRSEEYYFKCLRIWERCLPSNHTDLAQIYNSIGVLFRSMGQYERSEDYYLKCIRIREAILPQNHPDLAQVYQNLATLYYYMGDYKRSEEYNSKLRNIRKN